MHINRKGTKLILYWDILFFVTLIRPLFAFMALKDFARFPLYAKTRRATSWVFAILSFAGFFYWIVNNILEEVSQDYLMTFGIIVVAVSIIGIDFHWSSVVFFYSKHPDFTPVKLFAKDSSEPKYAFEIAEESKKSEELYR